jgi:replicative DNA helicase
MFDRLPPQNLEAEMCLLASMMLADDPALVFATVPAMLPPAAFFSADHQIIYDDLVSLHKGGKRMDAIVLKDSLQRRGLLDEVGGVDTIRRILDTVPSAAHWKHYAEIVREKAMLRGVIALANDAIQRAYAPAVDDVAAAIAMELAAKASKLAATGQANTVHALEQILGEVIERGMDKSVRRIMTGIDTLDEIIGGFRLGGKSIVGGKPGMGKSQLLKQIARNISGRGVAVGIITIEESRHKIGENLLSNESGVINNRIAFNTLGQEEWNEITHAVARISRLPIYVIDSARKLEAIVAAAHILACRHECKVIIVDHLHIVDGGGGDNREREISRISAELKWAWKELNVAGVEAAQLNRNLPKERPQLTSLRDSGSLEQDADIVILLHRDDYYRMAEPNYQPNNILEAIVAKNKDGAAATATLTIDPARQRVADLREEYA